MSHVSWAPNSHAVIYKRSLATAFQSSTSVPMSTKRLFPHYKCTSHRRLSLKKQNDLISLGVGWGGVCKTSPTTDKYRETRERSWKSPTGMWQQCIFYSSQLLKDLNWADSRVCALAFSLLHNTAAPLGKSKLSNFTAGECLENTVRFFPVAAYSCILLHGPVKNRTSLHFKQRHWRILPENVTGINSRWLFFSFLCFSF